MIENGFATAKQFGPSFLVLDRYFLTVPALKRLGELNAGRECEPNLVEIITKAKRNCRAYEEPPETGKKRGRPRKKGDTVCLGGLFRNEDLFKSAAVTMYGESTKVQYLCRDLLWGQKLYKKLRFVLVRYKGTQSILVSTDLKLDPVTIIELYASRFGIESCFRELKQQIGGFGYHFWKKSIAKQNLTGRRTASLPPG